MRAAPFAVVILKANNRIRINTSANFFCGGLTIKKNRFLGELSDTANIEAVDANN